MFIAIGSLSGRMIYAKLNIYLEGESEAFC